MVHLSAIGPWIILIEPGISKLVKDVQELKHLVPIRVTELGIVIAVNDVQPSNALFPK